MLVYTVIDQKSQISLKEVGDNGAIEAGIDPKIELGERDIKRR
jgi:hypothetical protein